MAEQSTCRILPLSSWCLLKESFLSHQSPWKMTASLPRSAALAADRQISFTNRRTKASLEWYHPELPPVLRPPQSQPPPSSKDRKCRRQSSKRCRLLLSFRR